MNNNTDAAAVGRRSIAVAAVILAGLAVSSAASAQQPESLIVDVGACVKLESPGERLDCYEEQVNRARARAGTPAQARTPAPAPSPAAAAPTAPPPAAAPPVAAARTVPAPAAAAPGASREAPAGRPARVEDAQVENARVPDLSTPDGGTVESTISALRETVPNAHVITLANGQIWRQDYAKAYRLQVGQRVRITREGRFGGGYRLTVVGMNGFIQVEQVR